MISGRRDLRAIILGGGPGWDESGFTSIRPLPLMPVAHWPLVCHTLLWLTRHGIRDITVCTNEAWRLGTRMLAHAAAALEDVTYFIDCAPRGTAGCIRDAAEQFGGQRFLVCDGTILPDIDLAPLLAEHERSKAQVTVVVTPDRNGRDGLAQRLSPVGIYVLEREVLDCVPASGFRDLKEMLLPKLYTSNVPVATYQVPHPCPRVIGLNSYLALCAEAAIRLAKQNSEWPGYCRRGEAYIHQSARVDGRARLIGPVLVGAESRISADATIIGPVTIGAHCTIEAEAAVSSSVIWDWCVVGRRSIVDCCVLADGAQLPAGRRINHILLPGTVARNDTNGAARKKSSTTVTAEVTA